MITVSLCMIVKNEEKVLKRCLDSIADLMDEIIIIDTGSTDSTKEIAYSYTDKVYDYEWCNDFSAARNYSFSFATKEYIYTADADEVLDETNRNRFKLLKDALLPEIDIVQMYYCNQLENGTAYNYDKEYRPKLYKRIRTFEWIEPVHEMVRLEPIIYDSDIEILHMPLSNHSGRDFKAFLRHFSNGNRLSSRLHHMYAMELFISGQDKDFLDAISVFEATLSDTTRSMDEIKEAMAILTKAYRICGNERKMFQTALKDVASTPSAETCCELGEYYYSANELDEACIWFQNALRETESILSIKSSGEYPLRGLAKCYDGLGEKELAEEYLKEAESSQDLKLLNQD
ncbi:MAG: glycosyltransferase [Lachnospiraceae bacterium]|nr:glycosyltransferase [Lachnospiraceae bacterium]